MIKNKRGLSNVITTLIIIALALAAVGIVWYVVTNVLTTSEEEITQGTTNLFQTCAEAGGTIVDQNATCGTDETKEIVGGEYCCVPSSE